MAVAGLAALGFVALAFYDGPQAREWLLALLHYPTPFEFAVPSRQSVEDMTRQSALFMWAGFGAVILILGFVALASGRTALRPANQSHDGMFEIALNSPQLRVGTTFAGKLHVMEDPKPGQVFRLDLTCICDYFDEDGKDRKDVGYTESQDVEAVQGAYGWDVPFAFEIPATAPVSGAWNSSRRNVFFWRLNVYPADAVASGSHFDDLQLGAATAADIRAQEGRQPPAWKSAIAEIGRRRTAPMQPEEYERLRHMTPAELALAAKGGYSGPSAEKVILIFFGVFFGGAAVIVGLPHSAVAGQLAMKEK